MEKENFKSYFVKLSCPKQTDDYKFGTIIENLINQEIFTDYLDNIPNSLEEAEVGDIVFIQLGGDNANKRRYFDESSKLLKDFVSGIYGIGLIQETFSDEKKVKLRFYGFEGPVTKKQLYYYPQFIDSLGASTKGIPNQAGLYEINNEEALSFIDYLKKTNNLGASSKVLSSIDSEGTLYSNAENILFSSEELFSSTTSDFIKNLTFQNQNRISIKSIDESSLTIDSFANDLSNVNLKYNDSIIKRFFIAILSKRFTILTGLSGSGKSYIAIALAKWFSGKRSRHQILTSTLNDDGIKNNYEIIKYSDDVVELINKTGSSGKIIPLPVELIFEWYEEALKDNFTENDDPKEYRHLIGVGSNYQKHIHGFYNELGKIALTMKEYSKNNCFQTYSKFEIVPVGADWTNREPLLGYPNALEKGEYVLPESGVLQLILEALKDPNCPYFLILDEMNLSHVERYFADFLSAIESGEQIKLHSGTKDWESDGYQVPPSLFVPNNLFIIGTVNIDETTYMFSPKVLDRANVLEFRVDTDEMKDYLKNPADVKLEYLEGKGVNMAQDFVKISTSPVAEFTEKNKLSDELMQFFEKLSEVGAEFGYRTANEISRFASLSEQLAKEWEFEHIMDAVISQKLLPKLHGSRRKLEIVLFKLGQLCVKSGDAEEFLKNPASINWENNVKYPISLEKIVRMHRDLIENGFTSFAVA